MLKIVALLALVSFARAESYTSGDWTYEIYGASQAVITSYNGTGGTVVIPAQLDGYPATTLGKDPFIVFGFFSGVTNVTIPSSVTNINHGAFWGSEELRSVSIPASVKKIGGYAFYECYSLTNVVLPNSVTAIEDRTFFRCFGLKRVTLPANLTRIGESAFGDCQALAGTLQLPNTVTNIGDSAFWRCENLTNVVIGSGVTHIGASAFDGCTNLQSVTVGSGVQSMGRDVFLNCPNLTRVILAEGATVVPEWAFSSLPSLSTVQFPSSLKNIETGAFNYSGLSGELVIPDGVTNVGAYAFSGTAISSVTIGAGVAAVGSSPFANCTNLTRAIFANGSKEIPEEAFYFVSSLSNVIIPAGVTNIGASAFWGTSLRSVTIPSSVRNIGAYAFSDLNSAVFLGTPPQASQSYFGFQSVIYYMPGNAGWGPSFAGRPTQAFIPAAQISAFSPASDFQFSWTGTGTIPMNVRRATSLDGPWTVLSTNNSTGQFTDLNPPSGKAFYQAYLP